MAKRAYWNRKQLFDTGAQYLLAFGQNASGKSYQGKLECFESLPSADVRENIHGEWIRDEALSIVIDMYKCSKCCGVSASNRYNFCPNCGADMRGEE